MPLIAEASPGLDVPTLPAAAIEALNLLLRPREPLTWEWAGSAWEIDFVAAGPDRADALPYPFSCDDQGGCVWVSADALQALIPNLTPALRAADPAQRSVLFEFALLQALAPLEAALGHALHFHEGPVQVPDAVRTGLRIGGFILTLELNPYLLQRLAQCWDGCTSLRCADWSRLAIPVALHTGWQRLEPADWAALVPGAVVMLEPGMRLVINRQHSVGVVPKGATDVQLLTPVDFALPPFDLPPFDLPSFDLPPRTSTMPTPPADPLDTTTLNLVCEVGRWQMPLAELRTLAEGSVLPVPGGQGDSVQLCVNGQAIGTGELVRIGEGLGVRITSLAHE